MAQQPTRSGEETSRSFDRAQLEEQLGRLPTAAGSRQHPADYVQSFQLMSAMGWLHEARAALETALELRPDDKSNRLRMVDFLAGHRDFEAALDHVDRGLGQAPEDGELGARRVHLLVELKHWEAACTDLAALAPPVADERALRVRLLMRVGLFDEALDLVGKEPVSADTQALRGRLHLWAGEGERAAACARVALDAHAQHALAHHVLGAALTLAGDFDAARSHLDAAISATPGGRRDDLLVELDAILTWRSELFRRMGDASRARMDANRAMTSARTYNLAAHMTRLLAVIGHYSPDSPIDPWAFSSLAERLEPLVEDRRALWSGRVGTLRDTLGGVLEQFGGNRSAYTTLTGEGEGLRRYFSSPYPRNESRRLQHLLRTRDVDNVMEQFAALSVVYPNHATALTYCGEVLVWVGRYADAEERFRQAIALDATTTWAWIGLGAGELLRGEPKKALATFAKGVEMCDYEGPTLYVYRAEARWRLGDVQGALEDLDKALRSKPHRLSAWVLRACIDAEQGDPNPANTVLECLGRAAPGFRLDAHKESRSDDPAEVLRAALVMMRGNRSSSTPTYYAANGELRFAQWTRQDAPSDLYRHLRAPGPATKPKSRPARKPKQRRSHRLALGHVAGPWLGLHRHLVGQRWAESVVAEVESLVEDINAARRGDAVAAYHGLEERQQKLMLVIETLAHGDDATTQLMMQVRQVLVRYRPPPPFPGPPPGGPTSR